MMLLFGLLFSFSLIFSYFAKNIISLETLYFYSVIEFFTVLSSFFNKIVYGLIVENRKEVDTDRKQKVVVVAKHRKEVDADPQEISIGYIYTIAENYKL